MTNTRHFTRRQFALATGAGALLPFGARAASYREITWDDLLPPGVPYAEIIGPGVIDQQADTWKPEFDENATKFNAALEGEAVKLPGYIIPMDTGPDGVTSFILVPYIGACIHVPPPPANQLVFVTTTTPWPSETLWDAIWVYGTLSTGLRETDIADIGYQITAEKIELYEW